MSPFYGLVLLLLMAAVVVLIACAVMAAEADEADRERELWQAGADERAANASLSYPVRDGRRW